MSTGKTAIPNVQTAVMALLAADATFMALVPGGVWDYYPADLAWPFVCLESAKEETDDTFGSGVGSQGRVVTLVFSIFSLYQGRSEQSAILNRMIALLHNVTVTVTGWTGGRSAYDGAEQFSILEVGNVRAGSTQATFTIGTLRDAA
jgi:hypothetical protein